MKIGVTVRNMGPQSRRDTLRACAEQAEALGFESLWITDHIAIPPDDAEGSGGRYTDPLTTLAWLGGVTRTIRLGVGALILPYRPTLPTAKAIATAHELTGERLLIGVGLGWMDAEFRALGVERRQRGAVADQQLDFLTRCFSEPVVELNGQPFIFDPRPSQPPIYVGGRAPHALRRALRFNLGWLPMARDAASLRGDLALFNQLAAENGRPPGPVTAFAALPLSDRESARDELAAWRTLGIQRLVCAIRYEDSSGYRRQLDQLMAL
ncbi:MAG: TIGR03619 family F420-dependent LLM class oxidoreductase [Gammaproteobacteria bacterium]|nr:TIGR03619 family F420-dependent LLM class oxidoreductase [Gammaproteobacteria bacterium]